MDKVVEYPEHIARFIREGKIRKPDGWIEDPEERRRIADELAGSMPELPTVEEFLKWRRAQSR